MKEYMVLGVAFSWGIRKGFDVFLELEKRLDKRYQIVLVGDDGLTQKSLTDDIIVIPRIQDREKLAKIYSAADVFINPTREDNYPTVNMEALACGTPVITFDTGGSPEILDGSTGIVVPCDDLEGLERAVRYVCEGKGFSREKCIDRAKGFDMYDRFMEYVTLWEMIGG